VPSNPHQAPRWLKRSSKQLLTPGDGPHDAVNLEPEAPLRWRFDLVFYFSEPMVPEDLLSSPTSDTTAGSRVRCARKHLAITISELQAHLERDHAWRAITA
jgi:hypothetical protein